MKYKPKKLPEWGKPKKRKAKKLPTERELVNVLLRQIKINTPYPVYIYVDRDPGQTRHTKSGWDFLISARGLVRFCEAKIEKGLLRPNQLLTKKEIEDAESSYLIVRFKNVKSLLDCDVEIRTGRTEDIGRKHSVRIALAQAKDFFIFPA